MKNANSMHKKVIRPQTATISNSWTMKNYVQNLGMGLLSLVKGMGLTMSYLVSPSKVITQQYPENRETLTMFSAFRGRLIMDHDQNREHGCTACGICERACPNGSISVLTGKDEKGKKMLEKYIYRLSQCTLCNLCVEACPFGAISMDQSFETAVHDRSSLTITLNSEEQCNVC